MTNHGGSAGGGARLARALSIEHRGGHVRRRGATRLDGARKRGAHGRRPGLDRDVDDGGGGVCGGGPAREEGMFVVVVFDWRLFRSFFKGGDKIVWHILVGGGSH